MRVAIDVASRYSGGYRAHLTGLLAPGRVPNNVEVLLYGTSSALTRLGPLSESVVSIPDDAIPEGTPGQIMWRRRQLPGILRRFGAHVHFNLTGYFEAEHHLPRIGMSRNLQSFVASERRRLPLLSVERLRVEISLRHSLRSFARASGMIYVSEYARSLIEPMLPDNGRKATVIPHGVFDEFRSAAKTGPMSKQPEVLYVSPVLEYKHQWSVVSAVDLVRRETGVDLQLNLVGGGNRLGLGRLEEEMRSRDNPTWVHRTGEVPYARLPEIYRNADIFVFASTVENCPNTLLEAMASGLPVVCSNRSPMPEFAGDVAMYFDPHEPASIAEVLSRIVTDRRKRESLARLARKRADLYSWDRTAKSTFTFLGEFA